MTTSTAPAALLDFQRNLQQSTEPDLIPHAGESSIAAMSWRELNEYVDDHVKSIGTNFEALIPAIVRVREELSCQGRRTDRPSDVPSDLTFTEWINSKRELLGSRTTVYRKLGKFLAGGVPQQKMLSVGRLVRDSDGEVGPVERAYTDDDGVALVAVTFKKGEPATERHAQNVKTVNIRKIDIGDRFIPTDLDDGYYYAYEGNRKLARAEKIPQKIAKSKPAPKPKLVKRKGAAAAGAMMTGKIKSSIERKPQRSAR
jgi:hypothetical protein